jgi:hypothetical protein
MHQYRKLVRQWHPDRFANDPQGAAEATHRLRLIIQAFETLRVARAGLLIDGVVDVSHEMIGSATNPN